MPVTFPVFPLTPNFDNSISTKASLNKSQYNSGGVIQRGAIGINTLNKTFKFQVNTVKVQQIKDFLAANLGKTFKLSFDGGVTTQPELWRIVEYKWKYYSNEVISLDCEMTQVRRYRAN